MKNYAVLIFSVLFASFIIVSTFAQSTKWKPVSGHIISKWSKDVSTEKVLPEYPRPQMVSNIVSEKFTKTEYMKADDNIPNLSNGIEFKYYEGKWDSLPDFQTLHPLKTGIVKNFALNSIKHTENFYGIEYSVYIKIPAEGIYTFYTTSDDGSKLFVDGKVIVNNDGLHGDVQQSGEAALEKGFHKIKLLYFQGQGGYSLNVDMKGPSIKKEEVPSRLLYYTK